MSEPIRDAMADLRAKIDRGFAERGLRRLTPDEYRAAQECNFKRVEELARRSSAADYERIGLREQDKDLSWSLVRPGQSDGYKGLAAVKEAYERGWGMVFLHGTYGQAKTLIGKILTATAAKDGKLAAYANMAAVLDDIRLAYDEEEHKTTELLRRSAWWLDRDVLFLDEIDRCNATQWAQERMFQLLDGRYMRAIREEALTVLASNKATGELDGYIQSRLKDKRLGPIVYMHGPDGRTVAPEGFQW